MCRSKAENQLSSGKKNVLKGNDRSDSTNRAYSSYISLQNITNVTILRKKKSSLK